MSDKDFSWKDSDTDFISELALHLRFTQSIHREIILCDYCEDDIAFCACAISNATIVNAFRPLDISLRYPLIAED